MFDNTELISVTRLSGSTGKAVFRFPVLGEYSNVYKALAGGAHATAHDYFTGHALLMIAKPGFWLSLGTSLSLNLTFLKPAQVGDVLLLEAEVRGSHACCPEKSGWLD
jgi:acyl-coenzyme A thioesterase 13